MTSIPIKKELIEDLIEFKLNYLDKEIKNILKKWDYPSVEIFIQDLNDGELPKASQDSKILKKLLDQKEEISQLKKIFKKRPGLSSDFQVNTNFSKIQNILQEVKKKFKELYGNRLKTILLIGSYARGEEHEFSDIDLAVILEGEVDTYKEINLIVDAIYDINLEYNVLISVRPISEEDFKISKTEFLSTVKEEGIPI